MATMDDAVQSQVRNIEKSTGRSMDAWLALVEESGKENVLRLLGRKGTIPVTVRLLDPLPPSDDRKALSNQAREAIAAALTSSRRPAHL